MVSVCIALYNGEKFIEKQLLSIKNQTKKAKYLCKQMKITAKIPERIFAKMREENDEYKTW